MAIYYLILWKIQIIRAGVLKGITKARYISSHGEWQPTVEKETLKTSTSS